MISLNVLNPKKKGKVTSNIFNLFVLDKNNSILFESNDFIEPIIWGTKGEIAKHLRNLDQIIFNGNTSMSVTVYTYKWGRNGWTLFCGVPWNGKISDIGGKNW